MSSKADDNSGGWFSSWFTTTAAKPEPILPTDEPAQESSYARNQLTLSSLRSQKEASSSSKPSRNSTATLIRTDAESYLDAPKSQDKNGVLRRKVTRRLQLTNNNLVIDCPIPDRLLGAITFNDHDEYSQLRYTAATCEPDEFEAKGFTLRPKIYNRETELFIVMTMYNVCLLFFFLGFVVVAADTNFI